MPRIYKSYIVDACKFLDITCLHIAEMFGGGFDRLVNWLKRQYKYWYFGVWLAYHLVRCRVLAYHILALSREASLLRDIVVLRIYRAVSDYFKFADVSFVQFQNPSSMKYMLMHIFTTF